MSCSHPITRSEDLALHSSSLRVTKHVRHAREPRTRPAHNLRRLINAHVLLLERAPLFRRRTLNLSLLMNTHALDAAQQIQHKTALHTIILAIRCLEFCEPAIKSVLVAHARQREDDGARDLVVEMDDAGDEGREVFLTVDKVGLVERGDGAHEDVVAEVVPDGALFFEAWEQCAKDAHVHDDGARVADADCVIAKEQDGFENGGMREDEVAHRWSVGVPA